jgi:ribose transport system substrate-binding protein
MASDLRRRAAVTLLQLSLAAAAGCAKHDSSAPVFAVIPKGTTHEFWVSIHAGAQKAAADGGVTIEWKGPPREDDRQQQIDVVEDFITKKVAGIVLAPLDSQALVPICRQAQAAGIPIVIVDSGLQWDGMVSFVATDNRKGGALAADRLGACLSGKGKVLMMRYEVGSASTMEREAGFLDEMKGKFPAIELVSTDQHGGATIDSAQRTAENLLLKFTALDGVFTPNESSTVGMLLALEDAGRAGPQAAHGRIRFVGFDASKKLVEGLKASKIDGLVVQNPFKMGELGVKTLVDHLAGRPVEKRIDTGCVVATLENMETPDVKPLLPSDARK